MAGGSMKEIKLRIRSVQNTLQITKAMELVASSKLRGARLRAERTRPYFDAAMRAVRSIAAHSTGSIYLTGRPEVKRRAYVVIAGDRGLAGSYNANVYRELAACTQGQRICVCPIGKKATEVYSGTDGVFASGIDRTDSVTVEQCEALAETLLKGFREEAFDEVYLIYTEFKTVLTQRARTVKLLPVESEADETARRCEMVFEPGAGSILGRFMPQYLSGVIYAAICESYLSEQAARRVAMDSASKNAGEMIEDLSLRYNRARQSSITQEITEIVAGAEH